MLKDLEKGSIMKTAQDNTRMKYSINLVGIPIEATNPNTIPVITVRLSKAIEGETNNRTTTTDDTNSSNQTTNTPTTDTIVHENIQTSSSRTTDIVSRSRTIGSNTPTRIGMLLEEIFAIIGRHSTTMKFSLSSKLTSRRTIDVAITDHTCCSTAHAETL